MKKFLLNTFWVALPALVLLGLWQISVDGDQKLQFLFASPLLVGQAALSELGHTEIWHHIFVTFSEAAVGLALGTLLGTVCGLLLWGNGKIDFITRPYIIFIGAIPIFALAPMTIIWFGIGFLSKVVMAGFAVFFVALTQAYDGAHAIAERHMAFARSINAPNLRIIQKIIIPGAIDWVLTGYKLSIGAALMGAFIGEFVSSEAGLGHYIMKATALYDVPHVLLGILLLSLSAVVMTTGAWFIQRRIKQ